MKERSEQEVAVRKAYINGFRPFVMYHPVGVYKGCFHNSQLHGYGIKTYSRKNLAYDGQWQDSKCHGQGTLRRLKNDGTSERIYVGQWYKGKRCGVGKMIYRDGVYYGWFKDNKPHGKGVLRYEDGRIYLGEWENGSYHGAGVLFYTNGNRYEGFFENGMKHGEGLYLHNQTGQVQKGVWCKDCCKTSIMFDEFRNQVIRPTPYPITKNELFEPDKLVKVLFREYLPEIFDKKTTNLSCMDLISRIRIKFLGIRV